MEYLEPIIQGDTFSFRYELSDDSGALSGYAESMTSEMATCLGVVVDSFDITEDVDTEGTYIFTARAAETIVYGTGTYQIDIKIVKDGTTRHSAKFGVVVLGSVTK